MKRKITATTFIVFLLFVLRISPVLATPASLSLSPSTGSYQIGQNFSVVVTLDTGGENTSGTDIYLRFDPNKIILADIVPGAIYGQYVGEEVNNSTGFGAISGLASSTSTLFTGSGTFATFGFKAIDSGTANITIDFTPGSSTDSNVAGFVSQSDILTSVNNASYSISGASTSTTTSSPGTTSTTSTTSKVTSDQLPVAASSSSTLIMAILSMIFIALGAITAKLSF